MTSYYRSHQGLVGNESTTVQRCKKIWWKTSQLVSQRCLETDMLLNENSLFGENSLSELPPFPQGPLGARGCSPSIVALGGTSRCSHAVGYAVAGPAWSLASHSVCKGGFAHPSVCVWVTAAPTTEVSDLSTSFGGEGPVFECRLVPRHVSLWVHRYSPS